jgi:hypothetical protein
MATHEKVGVPARNNSHEIAGKLRLVRVLQPERHALLRRKALYIATQQGARCHSPQRPESSAHVALIDIDSAVAWAVCSANLCQSDISSRKAK